MYHEGLDKVIAEILRQFPKLSEKRATQIAINTPVCHDEDVSIDRRAVRAVRAYIRHELTEYDYYADTMGKVYARDLVERDTMIHETRLRGEMARKPEPVKEKKPENAANRKIKRGGIHPSPARRES